MSLKLLHTANINYHIQKRKVSETGKCNVEYISQYINQARALSTFLYVFSYKNITEDFIIKLAKTIFYDEK